MEPSSRPPHVYTLTGNLLAERTLEFTGWEPGRTQRAAATSFQVGGKGINVAKMLRRLGAPVTALCFTGGASGAECEAWLHARGFSFQAFASDAATRTGTVVRDRSGRIAETTFLAPDVIPGPNAVRSCAAFLDSVAPGQVLAFCGSFPGWDRPEMAPLREAIGRWTTRGALVVDTYGPPLAELVARAPALLKVNRDEWQTLPAGSGGGQTRGRTVITDGPRPIEAWEAGEAPRTFRPPVVQEVSATGSGDVFLACLIEALFLRGTTLPAAVEFAMPQAAANAAHPGIAEYPSTPAGFPN